jgi:hypothetical protein
MIAAPRSPGRRRTATRIDAALGIREDALFVERDGRELFCMLHRPPGTSRGVVVLCPSFSKEAGMLYRFEVTAARTFAESGYTAVRFHYRGTGHSGGPAETMTLESMAADARLAAEAAEETDRGLRVFCGVHAGALAAAAAAAPDPGCPVVLWEPVVDGSRYLRAFLRAQNILALARGLDLTKTVGQVEEEIERRGFADVQGYAVHRSLYRSLAAARLREILASAARPVLLVQVGVRHEWKAEYAALGESLAGNGTRLERALISGEDPTMWFVKPQLRSAATVIGTTLRWLGRLEVCP